MRPLQLEFYACHSLPLCAVSAVAFCKRMCRPWSAVGGHYGKGLRKFGCGNGVGIWEASAYHLWVDEPIDARWGQTTFGRSAGCGEMLLGGCYMICVTGDTHGNQDRWLNQIHPALSAGDIIIIAGDFGVGFWNGRHFSEETFYDWLEQQNYTVLFVDGNHCDFDKLQRYPTAKWCGGKVHQLRRNLLHLMRGKYTGWKRLAMKGKSCLPLAVGILWTKPSEFREKAGGRRKCQRRKNMPMDVKHWRKTEIEWITSSPILHPMRRSYRCSTTRK